MTIDTELATLRGAVSMATQEFCISPQEEQPYWDALDRVEAELARLQDVDVACDSWRTSYETAEREIARLREGLREICALFTPRSDYFHAPPIQKARALLADTAEDGQ